MLSWGMGAVAPEGQMTAVLPVTLTVGQPHELVERYYPNGKLGGVAVDGSMPGALGQLVLLTVHVRKPAREFVLRGQLAWARHKAAKGQPASFGVDFLPEDDAVRVRLMAFARNEVGDESTRLDRRLQVELPVRLVHLGKARKEFLADLSTGGAFVRTWNPIPSGEYVELFVRPPLSFTSLHLPGYVVWTRAAGKDPGMGIEFVRDLELTGKLQRLLGKLARN